MEESRIKLDKSACSIVVLCTACPWWRGFALDRIEGWSVGARHQSRLHPHETQAAKQLYTAKQQAKRRRDAGK